MNANVAGGVGGEDEGSLPQDMMPQNLTETVYLGRASFRITHEIETVSAEEPPADSSTWFARDASVILQGGPSVVDRLTAAEERGEQLEEVSGRSFKRSWLMVAVPVAAFALGLLVAPLAGSSARFGASRHMAEAARTVVPPALPPSSIAAPAAPPVAPPVVAVPVVPAAPAPAPAAVATPPAPVTMVPRMATAEPPQAPPERAPMASRQGRPARRLDVRIVKAVRPAAPDSPSVATDDDAPATVEARSRAAAKAAAANWVDPWAN